MTKKPGYDSLAITYDSLIENSPYYVNIRAAEKKLLLNAIQKSSSRRFLDIGCGTGFALQVAALYGLEVYGVDPSVAMLEVARRRLDLLGFKKGHLINCRAENLSKMQEPFDIIVALGSVINHIDNWEAFFRSIQENSQKGTQLLLTVDNKLGLDAFTWAFYLFICGKYYGLSDLYKRLLAVKQNKPHLNEWTFKTLNNQNTVHLRYESPKKVFQLLEKYGFRTIKIMGTNCLASLSMATILSCEELFQQKTRVGSLLSSIDRQISKHVWPLSGNYVIWAERTN
jgi:ubiquinone/menaquinone biosynthesis C-methylase UbiE